jgi:hypothetical protein
MRSIVAMSLESRLNPGQDKESCLQNDQCDVLR